MPLTRTFEQFAAICAFLVALGALLYAALFIAIVEGAGPTTYDWWYFALMVGGAVTIPVLVALALRLAAIDAGFALTMFSFGLLGAFGGILHGGYNLGQRVTPSPGDIGPGPEEVAHGILRYAVAGVALLLMGWLLDRSDSFPDWLAWLAYVGGAVLVFIYIGRLFDFITPGDYFSLLPPIAYGFVIHPLFYAGVGLTLWRLSTVGRPETTDRTARASA